MTLSATQTGDPDGTGSIDLAFDTTTGEVCSTLTTSDIAAPTAAHIHEGVAGSAGPIVITLSTGATIECSDNDPALVSEIVASPADYYVNVHNADYPDGAIRNQVTEVVDSPLLTTRFELLPTGDADGSGTATLGFTSETNLVCYELEVETDETVTAAHIHEGAAGVSGPIVVDFDLPTNGMLGCVTAPAGQVDEILADPAGYYVNVHTDVSPDGAVRNQITAPTPVKTSTTVLDGLGFGDPDGSGDATFTFYDNGDVCYTIDVADIGAPTAAHIHTGADGVQGPVLIGLSIDETGLMGCTSSTVENVSAILASPADFYVNVHNAEYPDGAIRAQLAATAAGATSQFAIDLVGTGDPDGTGTAALDIDGDTGRVCFEIATTNTGNVTVAHIHRGGAAATGDIVVDFDVPANGLSGCVFASVDIATEIVASPADFYVNVHTAEAPAGAVRAQVDGTPPAAAPTAPTATTTTTTTTTTVAPKLPATGTDNGLMAIVAGALLAAGAGFVLMSRRNTTTG